MGTQPDLLNGGLISQHLLAASFGTLEPNNDTAADDQFKRLTTDRQRHFNERSRNLADELRARGMDISGSPYAALLEPMNFIVDPNDAGTLIIKPNKDNDAKILVRSDGGVGIQSVAPVTSEEYTAAALEGARVVMATRNLQEHMQDPEFKGVPINARDELHAMIITKASELSGFKVSNPPETSLDEAYPEIARQMERQWKEMQTAAEAPAPSLIAQPLLSQHGPT